MIELTAKIAKELVEIIEEEDPQRIIFDEKDKFNQGRCVVINGPSDWVDSAKGDYAMIYICLDAGAWGTLTEHKKEQSAITNAKKILRKLEEEI